MLGPLLADEVGFLRVALEVGLFGNEKRGFPLVTVEV